MSAPAPTPAPTPAPVSKPVSTPVSTPAPTPDFASLLAEVKEATGRFGHREHVHLTWLAVRRLGVPAAADLIGDGIRAITVRAGVPEKFHATLTRAWVELVGHHAAEPDADDFARFADRHPHLLDKELPTRFYRPGTLDSPRARAGWVEPDLAPFPRQDTRPHPDTAAARTAGQQP
ncbi:hypothetical protein AB4039_31845 [Streptomyces sp. M-16]|uniref:hypothetical protein n=1 Tax=Streptomyces sp. M-16 TaxID=3233040 RepID=UPI003F9D7138